METEVAVEVLAADPDRTGLFTDFDGTLSEIVDRPEDASAVGGASEVLEALAQRFAIVAVVSGRALDDLRSRLNVPGVILGGSYGRERSDRSAARRATEGWETVAAAAVTMTRDLPGVVLERKGSGIALHFRQDPEQAEAVKECADVLAREFSLDLRPGRMVVELVQPGPGKGEAVAKLAAERELHAALVSGDDVGDVEAFEWARTSPIRSVVVGVVSEEAPADLAALADLVVPGPVEFVQFLRRLAAAVG